MHWFIFSENNWIEYMHSHDIYRPLTAPLLTIVFVLSGDLIMFLPVSADSWISLGQSVHCVVSTKEVQVPGLAIVSVAHPSSLSLFGTYCSRCVVTDWPPALTQNVPYITPCLF